MNRDGFWAVSHRGGLRLALLLSGVVVAGWAGSTAPLPQPVPQWRVEVVAEAPAVQHPSVVACAPDGRVFVAEDPMDIRLPRADVAEGRILCLHPDGRTTVFAEKLYAVFGLQYLEGRVYVLHNPKFSVFDDDQGVGRNRRELIAQTLPNPSALNWNDHVPANFHLAMDGFFYGASGDKGLHGATGTDGSRVDLHTGGIFRLRPDGSQLEIFAHGVRNVLDVALNAEDELFTYDNTDEHEWMGRFTHMVAAGFYGYPHDFIPRRPETLWMMDDFGAGAACGAFANTEDALPPEYQGNVFLADFGKRQVLRVGVERSGGTYRVVSREDLFPNPPGDFRPVGITPGPDGKSLYICDWQHRDEKASVHVGRLLKLTWTGRDHSTPKPGWYLPAALGRSVALSTSDLIAGLAHPARSVRLTAQRRLAERGETQGVRALLRDASAPTRARQHAVWALDGVGLAPKEWVASSRDPDPGVRRQAVRALGHGRRGEAVPDLCERLMDSEASVRFQAATALGRIGAAAAVPALLAALEETDLFARYASFTALHRIGTNTPSAWPAIVRGLTSEKERIREGTYFALRDTYDEGLLTALVALRREVGQPNSVRRDALRLIGALHHQRPAWNQEWWAYHPALQPPPAKTANWTGTETVLAVLRDGLRESDAGLRRACIEGLAEALDTNAAPALRASFSHETDPMSRATILRALGAMKDAGVLALVARELTPPLPQETTRAAIAAAEAVGGEESIRVLSAFLSVASAEAATLAQAVGALGRLRAHSAAALLQPLTRHTASLVRAAALEALGRLQGEVSLPTLLTGLADSELEVRRASVKALDQLRSTNAIPALLRAYADVSVRPYAFLALAHTPDARALAALVEGLSSRNPSERNIAHLALRQLSDRVLTNLEGQADRLPAPALLELRQIYAGNPLAEAGPLFARSIRQPALAEYEAAAEQRSGDPGRGQKLFAASGGVNCIGCHRVAGQGGDVGPDLSGVGIQFDPRALVEAILYPSKTVREGYQQITFEMEDGEEYRGVVKGETGDILILRDSSGAEHQLARATIKARHISDLSLMPEGLHSAMSLEEFADLIAYLASLRGLPKPVGGQ